MINGKVRPEFGFDFAIGFVGDRTNGFQEMKFIPGVDVLDLKTSPHDSDSYVGKLADGRTVEFDKGDVKVTK